MKPVRTALFAPGINPRIMAKAVDSGADAVIFDLEDSVPIASKAEARSLVAKAISEQISAGQHRPAIYARVNGVASGYLDEDLKAVTQPGIDAIMLPKVEAVEEVRSVAEGIARHEKVLGMDAGSVLLILQIESALGVHRCFDLASSSSRVGGICFGGARDGDLQNDLACAWSIEGTELLYARSKVLLETRAAGSHLCPLDGVFSDLGDEAGLSADSRLSARLGYVGRTVIHPKQIAPVRAAYALPAADVEYFAKVVAKFESAEKAGAAAITVNGKLVDYAMYRRAKRALDFAKLDA